MYEGRMKIGVRVTEQRMIGGVVDIVRESKRNARPQDEGTVGL